MTIDEAIELLKAEKKAGVKSVIIAWWNANMFNREDNEAWEHAAEVIEDKMDWSATHSDLHHVLDLYTGD
jgi:hypothetical protein